MAQGTHPPHTGTTFGCQVLALGGHGLVGILPGHTVTFRHRSALRTTGTDDNLLHWEQQRAVRTVAIEDGRGNYRSGHGRSGKREPPDKSGGLSTLPDRASVEHPPNDPPVLADRVSEVSSAFIVLSQFAVDRRSVSLAAHPKTSDWWTRSRFGPMFDVRHFRHSTKSPGIFAVPGLSSAYVLVERIRRVGLAGTVLERAEVRTIRSKSFKVGGWVQKTVRQVVVRMSTGYPWAELFEWVVRQLTARRCRGGPLRVEVGNARPSPPAARPPAGATGPDRVAGRGQPTVHRRDPLDRQDRRPVAGPPRAVRQVELGLEAVRPLGPQGDLADGLRSPSGPRPGVADPRLDRGPSPPVCRRGEEEAGGTGGQDEQALGRSRGGAGPRSTRPSMDWDCR